MVLIASMKRWLFVLLLCSGLLRLMNIYRFRKELRDLTSKELLEMAFKQKEKGCILGGLCQYKIVYEGAGFCISEVLRKGCAMEYLRKLLVDEDMEDEHLRSEEILQLSINFRFLGHC